MSMHGEFKLFCWVLNRSTSPFSIRIPKSETVGHLKQAIKAKMELDGLASDLVLWKVSGFKNDLIKKLTPARFLSPTTATSRLQ
jgi:hypothetical protein